jgi:hypothetical protein
MPKIGRDIADIFGQKVTRVPSLSPSLMYVVAAETSQIHLTSVKLD